METSDTFVLAVYGTGFNTAELVEGYDNLRNVYLEVAGTLNARYFDDKNNWLCDAQEKPWRYADSEAGRTILIYRINKGSQENSGDTARAPFLKGDLVSANIRTYGGWVDGVYEYYICDGMYAEHHCVVVDGGEYWCRDDQIRRRT